VTSSITVLHALLWEKLSVYDQIIMKNLKGENMDINMNFYLKDDLQMEFVE